MAEILNVYTGTNGYQYSDWATSSYGDIMGQLFYYLSVDSTTCSIYIGELSVLAKKSNTYSQATQGHWRWRTYHSNPDTYYPSLNTLYTDSTNRAISTSEVLLDNGTADTYTPAFTINANALSWNNTYTEGTFIISGRVVKPSGTSNADSDSHQATPSQIIKLHLNKVSWSQTNVTKTLNYSSSDQFVTTIAEPTGGSDSFTYELTGDTGYLYLRGRNIYAKGGTSYLTGYSNKKVAVVVKDKYTGRNLALDLGVKVTVTMKPKTEMTYNIEYNLNGGNLADQSINSHKVIVNPRGALTYNPANGDTIQQNYFQLTFPTKIGYEFIGWTITGMDTSPHSFWYADNDASNGSWHNSNSTSFNNLNINDKHLYVYHPTATDGATITITANWQFRGNYIYKNDTDKWVKVAPFVYDGSTWRETQPFVYTSNGWKSLIN